ncbi:putative nucleic acid-binding Zn ribbon protein [Actinomadura rupiterrae]|nr:putative nucleic acid-binding Zn ribbon protein [Actinomadura rupiterrae]
MPRVITGQSCTCGARIEPGNRRCRKCRARARYARRREGSRYPDLWN